ncbi:MAG: hypothetical protein RML45_10735 [Acetobacteraceae bacterium]|nr:hypothetical protein [Acetobacteraceae bacterium]
MLAALTEAAPPAVPVSFRQASATPETWAERGVVLPLTTPALAFARLRRHGTDPAELVLRGPDGTRGWYAIPLGSVHDYASPSLFDRAVLAGVAAAGTPTPQAVAEARRAAVLKGLAGREAAAAEADRERRDQAEIAAALAALVASLVERKEEVVERRPVAADSLVAFVQENRALLDSVARSAALATASFVSALHALAVAVAFARRLEGVIARLRGFAADLSAVAPVSEAEEAALRFVSSAVSATVEAAQQPLGLFSDASLAPMRTIRAAAASDLAWRRPLDLAARILDGWSLLVSVWEAAGGGASDRLLALWLIGRSLPPLPRELDAALARPVASATVRDRWPDTPARLRGRSVALRQALLERLLVCGA